MWDFDRGYLPIADRENCSHSVIPVEIGILIAKMSFIDAKQAPFPACFNFETILWSVS